MAVSALATLDVFLPGGLIDIAGLSTDGLPTARTAAFSTLVLAQLFNTLNSRSETVSALRHLFVNKWLWGAIALGAVLQVAVMEVPVLQTAFSTTSLDLTELALDDVLKIAVYAFGDAESECYEPLSAAVPGVQTVVSGAHWVDMMARTASKGRALAAVQERLGITPVQTAVFGDYLNDTELYDYSELSFAMANAHPGILSRARYIAPANTDDGVLRMIETLLDRLSPR